MSVSATTIEVKPWMKPGYDYIAVWNDINEQWEVAPF